MWVLSMVRSGSRGITWSGESQPGWQNLTKSPVGASLLAMIVNDNAEILRPRGALRFFASRLAPTGTGTRTGFAFIRPWRRPAQDH